MEDKEITKAISAREPEGRRQKGKPRRWIL
jgi:hypothetical protein